VDWFSDEAKRAKSEYDRILRRNIDNMAKEIVNANAKIHVLADETLGGIKREYVEVDRKAEVGDKIVIVDRNSRSESYENGEIFTVERVWKPLEGDVESDEAKSDANGDGLIFRREYHVLEPTDIVHIDGERYKMVEREAKVGEKIIVVRPNEGLGNDKEAGIVGIVSSLYSAGDVGVKDFGFVLGTEYRVLVPVESAEDEPKPADPIDVIASLAQEVASLKRTVDRHRDEIDTLHKDKRTLGEELARLKQDGNTQQPTGTSFADFCEGYIAYSKAMKGARQ
jgi:predicted RNA-binding protein